ncbi:SpaH/EbpB family LPXTG-anchored major pilin [Streptococcus suis]|uniref:SpaH/EbpB family LPXTG-anchored major pilin n=1 Tax=Streptococcus suis TaxID=1307 RepID=A0A9X4MT05_STRSU|nr:SpaH/EbpB family LPXTG-anchored major pilin [Streptococcus suis]
MKLIRKLVTGLMILLLALGSSPLEVFAYDPFNQFPVQTQREWPTQNVNNVATNLPLPPAKPNTVNMLDMFHYPLLIYTEEGSVSQDSDQTALLANNRSYVTETDSSVAVITRDARWQSGVMWSNEQNKIKLSEPFHMIAYVYLGNRTQYNKNFNGLGGADGITFTIHNDNKKPEDIWAKDEFGKDKLASGSVKNTGMNAYGALGNGLGVYGSNFSANVSSKENNMVDFWRGVENGITLEFDTYFNDNDTTQHSDNDLTSTINKLPPVKYPENHVNTQHGHIAINLLNDFKDNKANYEDTTTNKHKVKLSLGWDGELSKDDKTNPHTWVNPPDWPKTNLADGLWHRLEVTWTPDLVTNTGILNYKIYKKGHEGSGNISDINDRRFDGDKVIDYTVAIGSPGYRLKDVFGFGEEEENLNHSVYWGFTGSTGGFLNNQAVQMLQLPVPYFELTLEKLSSSTFQEPPQPLKDVEFKLYDSADGIDFSNLKPKATVTTGAEGKIILNNEQIQADKTYYLVESKTVGGFIKLKGYFIITTVNGINVTYVKADSETDSSPFEFTSTSTDTSYAGTFTGTLKIYNKKLILPATGGNGILGYVGIGLTMTIVALLFFIARKRIFKWLVILIVATSGLAGLAGGTQVVSAQEQEQVQLEVNRLVYQPSDTQYKSGVPVAGAKLEVVDVTKSFYELVNRQKLSLKEAQEAVSKSNKIDGQSLAVATTDQSGLVRFTVSKTSQQRPAVYLIRELVTPVAVTKMENMVVVLPILDESGNEKSLISLFPKSHGIFTFDKTIDEKQSSYSFGEPIPYRLSTIIPQDMTNLSSYEIEDIYDQGLRFISESLEIFIDGEKQSDSIKAVNLSENQFRVVFDVAKLADFGGKKLEVTYQMVIKDEAAIDQDLVNTATLYPGDLSPLVDRENVRTGGFRFIKRAAEGKQNPLAKATFVIKNPTDDTVLTYKEGKYQFEKVATNASGVVRLTSDDDGYLEIRGLRYGEYLVSEIRAPSGYVLQDKPTAFTVGVSTYSQGPVLSIFNVKKPKIRLPETGTVATSTAFVGLLIMASSLVMIRRRKDN